MARAPWAAIDLENYGVPSIERSRSGPRGWGYPAGSRRKSAANGAVVLRVPGVPGRVRTREATVPNRQSKSLNDRPLSIHFKVADVDKPPVIDLSLARLVDGGLPAAGGRRRTDATHILAAVRDLSRPGIRREVGTRLPVAAAVVTTRPGRGDRHVRRQQVLAICRL